MGESQQNQRHKQQRERWIEGYRTDTHTKIETGRERETDGETDSERQTEMDEETEREIWME